MVGILKIMLNQGTFKADPGRTLKKADMFHLDTRKGRACLTCARFLGRISVCRSLMLKVIKYIQERIIHLDVMLIPLDSVKSLPLSRMVTVSSSMLKWWQAGSKMPKKCWYGWFRNDAGSVQSQHRNISQGDEMPCMVRIPSDRIKAEIIWRCETFAKRVSLGD